jgi:AAA+ ATPase superfamily predicted ATPase
MLVMQNIIGRKEEIKALEQLKESPKPAFLAIYGRRRVGKTYLVKQFFGKSFSFYMTGVANVAMRQHLSNFHTALVARYPEAERFRQPKDWFQAFQQLISILEIQDDSEKIIIFLDELPWLDTPKSGFIPALEHFWNSWASSRNNILLIVCGSAASWMINNLINHRGGLHNRVTHRLILEPFTLAECEQYFKSRGMNYERYQILQIYMVTGGIPFYLEQIDKGLTAIQNIDRLCFKKNGMLRTEFDNLYTSLFKAADKHALIIETLAKKNKGMSRDELIQKTLFSNGGSLTRILTELEESGFIRRYKSFGHTTRNVQYQVSDFYSLFYLKFIKNADLSDQNSWLDRMDNPEVRAWSGYAFEQICMAHLSQIKHALGIGSVQTQSSVWQGSDGLNAAQVDLVIDRRDQAINLCEMKFSINRFVIDKAYAESLRQKIGVFKATTATRKSIFLTFITTFGLAQNEYAGSLVQNALTMDALFDY